LNFVYSSPPKKEDCILPYKYLARLSYECMGDFQNLQALTWENLIAFEGIYF
jgi:hypothetical protein